MIGGSPNCFETFFTSILDGISLHVRFRYVSGSIFIEKENYVLRKLKNMEGVINCCGLNMINTRSSSFFR